ALARHHMHRAARYTAFGADLQADPKVRGEVIGESLLRRDSACAWRPVLHLNDHGYPAHGWVRTQTGHLPRGFEDWSLPVGHLTILTTHVVDATVGAALRDHLAADVERALLADADVRERTLAQLRRSRRYRDHAATPFEFRSGLPFWGQHRPHPRPVAAGARGEGELPPLAPLVTLITEVPDETVDGAAWHACVRSHAIANEAMTRSLLDWLQLRRG
ncbi:MAG: hypothetical protein K0A98_08125, partial [Trueperaceae bacterium]|nr:hypothetical protein [Trueperaceae bacterium]